MTVPVYMVVPVSAAIAVVAIFVPPSMSSGGVVNYDSVVPCLCTRGSLPMPTCKTAFCDRYVSSACCPVGCFKSAALAFDRCDLSF